MKPRIFVSSTYYDLKYVRESLEKFLHLINFEPVLFVANKVTFEHGKPLDVSCFNEVKTCHIMILIIGGRYGAIISDQDSEIEKGIYDKEYISITRKEYETALLNNIPTFIFVDKNVFGEYNTYKINRNFYESAINDSSFKFFHVDSINVFKFIEIVSTKALKTFERIEEIELYLKDQISGMFHLYLESLKQNSKQDDIFDAVKELKSLTTNMNTLLNEVGKKIIDPEKYEEVIEAQYLVVVNFFMDKLTEAVVDNFSHADDHNEEVEKIFNVFYQKIFTPETYDRFVFFTSGLNYSEWKQSVSDEVDKINSILNKIVPGLSVNQKIQSVLVDYFEKLKILIRTDEQENIFKEKLKHEIRLWGLPF